MTGLEFDGRLRQCRVCVAPMVAPFPADWSLDLIKEGPPEGPVATFYTPHRPGCTAPYADPVPGMAVRISGSAVQKVTLCIDGVTMMG